MARCGCAQACLCGVVGDGETSRVTGQGSSMAPYTVRVMISADPSNLLSIGADGLLVNVDSLPTTVESSTCIDLSGAGTPLDPLIASPILDPDTANILSCGSAGLSVVVPGTPLFNPIEVIADYEVQFGDLVHVDTSGGDVTVTLPDVGLVPGGIVFIKRVSAGANSLTVSGYSGQVIDGSASVSMASQWNRYLLASTGTEWLKLGSTT